MMAAPIKAESKLSIGGEFPDDLFAAIQNRRIFFWARN
jgi:hypothetical protein